MKNGNGFLFNNLTVSFGNLAFSITHLYFRTTSDLGPAVLQSAPPSTANLRLISKEIPALF